MASSAAKRAVLTPATSRTVWNEKLPLLPESPGSGWTC